MPFLSVITNYIIRTGGILAFFVASLKKHFDKVCITIYLLEFIYGHRIIITIFPAKDVRREVLMMNGIRIILGLQGESASIIIGCACFSLLRCDKVACVELYAGLLF